jgi:hypothetical protein
MELTEQQKQLILAEKKILQAIYLAEKVLFQLGEQKGHLTSEQEQAYVALLILKLHFGLNDEKDKI